MKDKVKYSNSELSAPMMKQRLLHKALIEYYKLIDYNRRLKE
jgi:hypothetical protein